LVKKVIIQPSWTVLDIGCGPGDVSIWAAKRAKHVTALDHSGKMLSFLKERFL
jgi:ubiquinone/menaquinone biosynthesis C-methylase UbiE